MRCAIVINDVVDNVIEVESLASAEAIFPDAECLDADAEGIGMGHTRSGGVWSAPVEAEPATPNTPEIYAIANLTITGGDVVSITPSAKIAGAFRIDTGVYWVFLSEELADTSYIPFCYNHGSTVYVTEKYQDFFVVNAETGGVPADPECISIEIKRVI